MLAVAGCRPLRALVTLRQRIDAGASGEAVEGLGRCTARRNAYGVFPDPG